MRLTFLSAIAGQSIFLLGPPGVAKSLIARRLKYAFKDAKAFEYLMHRFSTPDEVFGPISISKLKNDDKLERVVDYYLPGANIAFLDEIWKAGPSIQNTLLTIINEKIYRNGEQELKVDLYGIIAASNELPEKGQGLEALWDRFLLRVYLKSIEDRENFEKMIVDTKNLYSDTIPEDLKISKEEYYNFQEVRDQVEVPKVILDLIHHVRVKIEDYNKKQAENENENMQIYVSDRRWKRIVSLLRTSAFLNGRDFVDLMDCFLIPYFVWNEPDQFDTIKMLVQDCVRHQGYTLVCDFSGIERQLEKMSAEIKKETMIITQTSKEVPKVVDGNYSATWRNYTVVIPKKDFDNLNVGNELKVRFYERPGYYNNTYSKLKMRLKLMDMKSI